MLFRVSAAGVAPVDCAWWATVKWSCINRVPPTILASCNTKASRARCRLQTLTVCLIDQGFEARVTNRKRRFDAYSLHIAYEVLRSVLTPDVEIRCKSGSGAHRAKRVFLYHSLTSHCIVQSLSPVCPSPAASFLYVWFCSGLQSPLSSHLVSAHLSTRPTSLILLGRDRPKKAPGT